MIDLVDLSSAVQLACGLNLAVGVVLQRHSAFITRHQEYVDYVRSVIRERVKEPGLLALLENRLVRTEHAIFAARFANLPYVKRLRTLCVVAGVISIVPLILPAFVKPLLLSPTTAISVLISLFAPIPLALVGVELEARRQLRIISAEKDELSRVVQDALQPES